jgi:two-component system, LuxR family, response regulator FixJ
MVHLVDDELAIRRALTILAKSANFGIDDFASGADFLKTDNIKEGDCLILDIHLPGMNGFELLEELEKRKIKLNVIILTAYDDAVNREKAMKYGVKAFFRKPCDSQALIDTINFLNSA